MSLHIVIEGRRLRPPSEYSVDIDMLEPADSFTMTLPLDKRTVDIARTDAECQIFNGQTPILTGYIVDAEETSDDQLIVSGLDTVGKLVAESVPGAGMRLGSVKVSGAVKRIVSPWFDVVEFSNATNRRLTRGRGRKALAADDQIAAADRLLEATRSVQEAQRLLAAREELLANRRRLQRIAAVHPGLTAAQRRQIPRRIDAGTKRWEALMAILEPQRLLAWSRGDGKGLVVASPQYSQAPQYRLVETVARSNVLSIRRRRSIGGRYQEIEVSGSGRPPGVPLPSFAPAFPGQARPKHVSRTRIGVATDTTGDFLRQKRLFVVSEALSQEEAQELAERMMGQGLINAEQIDVTMPGHGETRRGTSLETLYTFDTVASVRREIEAAPGDDTPTTLINGNYFVTRVGFEASRGRGETTRLSMSPIGARIT